MNLRSSSARTPGTPAFGFAAMAAAGLLLLAACGGVGATPAATQGAVPPASTGQATGAPQSTSAAETAPAETAGASSAPETSAPASSGASGGLTIGAVSTPNGLVLTGANGMTVYVYSKDKKKDVSTCTAACLANWPAVTVSGGKKPAAGTNVTGKLATFKRADGTTQVSYNGAPLYYFAADQAAGDMNGDGVGGFKAATPTSTIGGKNLPTAPAPTGGY